jgi:hypothetical protein
LINVFGILPGKVVIVLWGRKQKENKIENVKIVGLRMVVLKHTAS